jgi:malate permease and related proteins
LSTLAGLFLNNLLPVFLAAAAGFGLGRWLKIEPRPIAQVSFYIFSPCLIFVLITSNHLDNTDFIRMMSFTVTLITLVGLVTWFLGRIFRLERRLLIAVVISAISMNAGNYGLSVNLFAFGEEALSHASLFFITAAIYTYTIGVMIASMGSSTFKQSLLNLARLPVVYAVAVAFVFARLGWSLPLPLERTVSLFANAAIPSMLVLLGLQLYRVHWAGNLKTLTLSITMRLVAAPLLAILLSKPFGLMGPARQAGILEAGMPTAVLATVLATEFDLEPSFITTAVFVSTIISPLTLTPLLAYLGA